MPKKEEKKLTLAEELKQIEKDYGKGSVIGGTECESYTDVISTGSIELDAALGIGGLPLGKIVEMIGWESCGKSTITLHIIAEAQKKGYTCLLVDGENSFDENYAISIGVDTEKLLIIQLDGQGGEKAYNIAERMIRTGEIQLVIIDSQNSLQPKKVMEGEVGDSAIGLHARMLGQTVVKYNNAAKENDCLIIFISQLREKVGVMFGSPETTQGGNALKFYSHIRLNVSKTVLKEDKVAYANETKVKVIKNKMAPPFKEAKFNIVYGLGIDKTYEVIKLGDELEILKKWGEKITYNELKYDLDEFKILLNDNPELYQEIRNKILEKLKNENKL